MYFCVLVVQHHLTLPLEEILASALLRHRVALGACLLCIRGGVQILLPSLVAQPGSQFVTWPCSPGPVLEASWTQLLPEGLLPLDPNLTAWAFFLCPCHRLTPCPAKTLPGSVRLKQASSQAPRLTLPALCPRNCCFVSFCPLGPLLLLELITHTSLWAIMVLLRFLHICEPVGAGDPCRCLGICSCPASPLLKSLGGHLYSLPLLCQQQ